MTLVEATPDDAFESHESSFADITERLFHQFESVLPLREIVNVVRDAREQLRGSPLGALPELTERLAMERLASRGQELHAVTGPIPGAALPEAI
ncbi:MAG TPA: hypothetical protein VHO01_06315 [Jatrophihabitans sp.]|nr:hypothetical protein [Jatrophihabitans sp.]